MEWNRAQTIAKRVIMQAVFIKAGVRGEILVVHKISRSSGDMAIAH